MRPISPISMTSTKKFAKSKLSAQAVALLVAAVIAFIGTSASAQPVHPISNLALFARCYGHLTGFPLPINHPLRAGLVSGSVNAIDACNALLDKGVLDASTFKVSATDIESQRVLKQMFEMHRTWFPALVWDQMQGFSLDGTRDLFDSGEGALALTYNLLSPSPIQYSQVLKETHGYYPLRDIDLNQNSRMYPTGPYHLLPSRKMTEYGALKNSQPNLTIKTNRAWSPADLTTSTYATFVPVYVGELRGIQADSRSTVIPNYYPMINAYKTGSAYGASTSENAAGVAGMTASIDIFSHQGGGILGQPSFMMINWGHDPGLTMNGGLKMPRRWIKNAMHALLCKEPPMLRASDVATLIDTGTDPTIAPFRQSSTCVSCHATMDQMASVGRNYVMSSTDWRSRTDSNGYTIKLAYVLGRFNPSVPSAPGWPSTPAANFNLQTPNGKVFFRTFNGVLIDTPVSSIQQIGETLSATDDFYQCAAKRYFLYFTGIDVQLFDRGDPRNSTLVEATPTSALKQRQFIEHLGHDLKTSQSLRGLMKEIISSDYYRDSDYHVTNEN
jgi:hypothetical protein